MRILFVFVFVAAPLVARADGIAAPGQCAQAQTGCGCSEEFCEPPLGPDMAMPIPRDLSMPRDLTPPSYGALDACRERARRRNRAHGRGLVLLSGLTAAALVALRRRYRTIRPTPADSALAASDTRNDS